jgi:outer membrane receptor for ferrienterochelin and colicins
MSRPALMVLAALLGPGALMAQQGTATLAGSVTESGTGRPLAGARVLLQGTLLTTEADSAGRFRFIRLDAGTYHLRVAALGFRSDTLPPIVLAAGETREVSISLASQVLELPSMVVTASRRVERIEEAQASIAVISRDELLRRNVVTMDQALAFVPGVTFNGASSQDPQIDIRGATGIARGVGSRVLMLLDGHQALSADGGEVLYETLPILDVEQVEVVKGAYSALYGSNALGGVVNLLTSRIAERPRTTGQAHFGVYTLQNQYDFTSSTQSAQGLTLQHSRWLGPVGVRAAVGRETSDGFTQNGQYERWFARTKLTSRPEANHPWDVFAVYSRNDKGEFFTWQSADRPYEVKPAELGDRSVYSQILTGATVTPVARSTLLLRVNPFLNWNENQNYFHDNTDWHRATKAGANALLSLQPESGTHAVTFGLDGAYTTVSSSFLGKPSITDGAIVVQDEIRFSDRIRGTIGARVDYHTASGASAETSVNPKASVVVTPSDRLSLRGSLARGYRAPSAIEQFVSTIQYGIKVIPNPDLTGEQAWSAEIGATAFPTGSLRIDGAVFQSSYDDLIGPAGAPGQILVFQFQNVAKARVRGLDVGARTSLIRDFADFQLSYMFLDSEDLGTGKALPYRSRHNVSGSLELFRKRFAVDYRYRTRVDEVLAYPADPRTNISVLDLRGSVSALGVTFMGKISNLLNTFYTDVQERSPGAPRNIALTVMSEF